MLNARSVRNKCCSIRDLIIDNSIDVFCIVESWLTDTDTSVIAGLLPDTHNCYHFPRISGSGGGVAVIISKSFKGVKAFNRGTSTFECLELHASFANEKIIFNVIYRPPYYSPNFLNQFESFLLESEMNNTKGQIIYVGDFNLWVDDEQNVSAQNFLTVLDCFNLHNIVHVPTIGSGHILDLIIVKKDDNAVMQVEVEPSGLISDHSLINFQINFKICDKVNKEIRFHRKNPLLTEMICTALSNSMNKSLIFCEHDGSPCINCIVDVLRLKSREIFENLCPLVSKSIVVKDLSNNWYNSDVRSAKRAMRKAEKKYTRNRTVQNFNDYKVKRQSKCVAITIAKQSYFLSKIELCGNDYKRLFNLLKTLLGDDKVSSTLPSHSSIYDLANKFKDFFTEKIDKIIDSFPNSINNNDHFLPDFPVRCLNRFSPVSPEETLILLNSMNKTYCKNDSVNMRLVDFDINLAGYLSEIVNHSFYTGEFPVKEKFAYINPLAKKGNDPDLLSSYRPIYNTSFLSKLLEKAALKQLSCHINSFNFLPIFQSAYRELHSVESALCRVHSDLISDLASGNCAMMILLDLSAAFDTIDRDLLLADLNDLGIRGEALSWVRSYLQDRHFCVVINDVVSDSVEMKHGVPQGTILGPFLFAVYVTSLQFLLNEFDVSFHCYADDTQIYFRVTDERNDMLKVRRLSTRIQDWMNTRRLKLNTGKTEVILLGTRQKLENLNFDPDIIFCDSSVQFSSTVRNLGVIFDENLSMKQQANNVKRKVIGGLVNISKIAKFINKESRIKLVHGLVLSQLDYCNSLYYGLPNTVLHSFQMLLNSAARVIYQMPRFSRERITPKCIELHFLPIKARIEYKICILTYKALNFESPAYLADLLKPHEIISDMQLRNTGVGRLHEPFLSRSKIIDRCYEHCAPRLYNQLPLALRMEKSFDTFKKKLKTLLFEKSYNLQDLSLAADYKC